MLNFPVETYLKGFASTQQLHLEKHFSNLYTLRSTSANLFQIKEKLRLGQFAEQIFFEHVKSRIGDNKLITNTQIITNNRTLGELDCLIVNSETVEHIEFCYKIYLFDPTLSDDEFYCWIGPNRRDALSQKVEKLNTKQLPLFYLPEAQQLLKKIIPDFLSLKPIQKVCFVGQLYVPYTSYQEKTYDFGTPDGFYVHFNDLCNWEDFEWFVPTSKIDWLVSPVRNVNWLSTEELRSQLKLHYERNSNPLCWVKLANGELEKCFVVNWSGK